MDFTPTTFTTGSAPAVDSAWLNTMEAALADASTHHKRGTFAAMPAAAAANKNWTYYATDSGGLYCNFDGATWTLVAGMEPWRYVAAASQPAFASGWSNYSPGVTTGDYRHLRFAKDAAGFVHIEGSAATTGTSVTCFTLPAGYVPTNIVGAQHVYLGANYVPSLLLVRPSGSVEPLNTAGNTLGAAGPVHFAAMFRAD